MSVQAPCGGHHDRRRVWAWAGGGRFAALARHTLRPTLLLGNIPAQALQPLDQAFASIDTQGRFCTAACGVIQTDADDPSITLAVLGHPPRATVIGFDELAVRRS